MKLLLCAGLALTLSGCFAVNQIRDKVNEDCYMSQDNINALSGDEKQRLSKKCGWVQPVLKPAERNNFTSFSIPMISTEKLCQAPILTSPTAAKNGTFAYPVGNGLVLKYDVKNNQSPNEINVYYPNGQVETHTEFLGHKANGWSNGYYPNGKLKTKFLYKDGKVTQYEVYDSNGNLVSHEKVICQ